MSPRKKPKAASKKARPAKKPTIAKKAGKKAPRKPAPVRKAASAKKPASAKKKRSPRVRVEKKAPPAAASSRRPTKREPVERVAVGGLRTLGDVEPGDRGGTHATKESATANRALEVLAQEFERALALKEKLAAESSIGGKEKGREPTRQQEKLRALVNSLEGMNRFAMRMGLVTPAQARELYAKAMSQGLYQGWR